MLPSLQGTAEPHDHLDEVRNQWERIFPGLDTGAAGVIGRISRLAQIIQLRSDSVLAANGITRAEFDVLSLLARIGRPMAPTELADELLISGAGVTKRLKRLEDAGMIRRENNPRDGRGALIHMTPTAFERLRPILESVLDFEASLLAGVAPSQRTNMAGDLRSLLLTIEPTPESS